MSHPTDRRRIYLDNAATSWPKPEAVYLAVERYQRELGAPAGRSGYAEAVSVSQAVEDVRLRVARLVGLQNPTHLVFTANGTDSLNLAIHGLLRPGDHVVTTTVEHNSVLRPLKHLERDCMITVTQVPCDATGFVDPQAIRAAIRSNTRLVAVSHASNVTGALQPVAEIAEVAHSAGAMVLCDAAQTAGHMSLDVQTLGADLLAAPGHKGLLGPLGTGILAIGPHIANRLHSIRQGGTGTRSEESSQPDELPSKFESGNLNVPGILGLGAGVGYLMSQDVSALASQSLALTSRLLEGLNEISGVQILGPTTSERRVPLVSIVLEGYDPQEVALALDAVHGIQVRPGLHCAPDMHRALKTDTSGGTVRFSLGVFNTLDDIETTIRAVAEIASSHVAI